MGFMFSCTGLSVVCMHVLHVKSHVLIVSSWVHLCVCVSTCVHVCVSENPAPCRILICLCQTTAACLLTRALKRSALPPRQRAHGQNVKTLNNHDEKRGKWREVLRESCNSDALKCSVSTAATGSASPSTPQSCRSSSSCWSFIS